MSDLVQVGSYLTPVEADLARLLLENEGIETFFFDYGLNSVGPGPLAPVRLMVLDRDLPEALRLLRDYKP